MIKYASQNIDKEDIKIVSKVLRGNFLTQGPEVKKFEKRLILKTNAKYAISVSSGTAALKIALRSLNLKSNEGVVVPAITFVATINATKDITKNIFISDIDKDTGCMSFEKFLQAVNHAKKKNIKIKTLINVHYAGQGQDVLEIFNFCKKNRIKIIEDACHSLGSKYKIGSKIYSVGSCSHSDITTFSFHSIKNITTGEGGCILTNNKKIYQKSLLYRSHGIVKKNFWIYNASVFSENYRLTDFQCALGTSQLRKLENYKKKKDKVYKYYKKKLEHYKIFMSTINKNSGWNVHWHLFPILLNKKFIKLKKKLFIFFKENNIQTQVHYIPIYKHSIYKNKFIQGFFNGSEEFYKRELSLPFHTKLTKLDIDYIFNILDKFLSKNKIKRNK